MQEIWQRVRSVLERPMGEDVLLVPVDAEGIADLTAFYRLEGPVARWLWGRLAEPAELETLADELVEQFEVDRAQALEDAREFLRELGGHGLVQKAR